MQDAINEFTGTPEEIRYNVLRDCFEPFFCFCFTWLFESVLISFFVRVMIANADFSLARGDIEQALEMLRKITPEQRYIAQPNLFILLYRYVPYDCLNTHNIFFPLLATLFKQEKKWQRSIWSIEKTKDCTSVYTGG